MQENVSMNARKCVHECKKVCPWMQESVSMNARKCVHAQKPCPSQAFAHESSKGGGRGKREEERQRPGGWWKERQNKNTSEELKQGLLQVNKAGGGSSPSHTMCPPAPQQRAPPLPWIAAGTPRGSRPWWCPRLAGPSCGVAWLRYSIPPALQCASCAARCCAPARSPTGACNRILFQ